MLPPLPPSPCIFLQKICKGSCDTEAMTVEFSFAITGIVYIKTDVLNGIFHNITVLLNI